MTQPLRPAKVYPKSLPKVIPVGKALVHNFVNPPSRRQGGRGSRYWLQNEDRSGLEQCGCEWARELGEHFRVRDHPYQPRLHSLPQLT